MKASTATKQAPAVSSARGRGLWWVVSCALSAALGVAVARPAAELVREPLSQVWSGLLTVALCGALFGACLGVGQALVRWRRGRSVLGLAGWMLASSVTGAVGYLLGVKLAAAITDSIRGKVLVYLSEALGYLVLGAVLGLLFGVVQAGLRSVSGQASAVRWIALSLLGWALGFVVAAGVGLLITTLPSITVRDLLFGGLTGLVAGGLEALGMARRTGIWYYYRS
jgi:hypothetical protein